MNDQPTTAEEWIAALALTPHVEGGHFRETYRAVDEISPEALPSRYDGVRQLATAIYFLLSGEEFSSFHRLRSDEIWHFHAGEPLTLYMIHPGGRLERLTLGLDVARGATPQIVIRAGTWFAARLEPARAYTLIGCTVSPGFTFADFELARPHELARAFPEHADLVRTLTRG